MFVFNCCRHNIDPKTTDQAKLDAAKLAKDKLAGEEEEDQEGGGDDDDEFEMPHFMQVEYNDLQKKLADKYVSSLFFFCGRYVFYVLLEGSIFTFSNQGFVF